MKFALHLKRMRACEKAVLWVGDRDAATAWRECERADWMIWLLWKNRKKPGWPNESVVRHCMVDCVDYMIWLLWKKRKMPLRYARDARAACEATLTVARCYANGTVPDRELAKTRRAAREALLEAEGGISIWPAWTVRAAEATVAGKTYTAEVATDAVIWAVAAVTEDAAARFAIVGKIRATMVKEMCALIRKRVPTIPN